MAKSLRSKWKRKMRAHKRVRYGAKENARLMKMLESYNDEEEQKRLADQKAASRPKHLANVPTGMKNDQYQISFIFQSACFYMEFVPCSTFTHCSVSLLAT